MLICWYIMWKLVFETKIYHTFYYEARVSVCILGVFCSFFLGGGGDDVMHNQGWCDAQPGSHN